MPGVMRYAAYEDPLDCARKVCEYHAANTGDPVTHMQVMVAVLRMGEPEARQKCIQHLAVLTGEGGEFHHLYTERKYAVAHKRVAEETGLPLVRLRNFNVANKMKLADDQRTIVEARKHTSQALKGRLTATIDLAEQHAGRNNTPARTYEMLERLKEIGATADSDSRDQATQIRLLTDENRFLRSALLGGRGLPEPEAAE